MNIGQKHTYVGQFFEEIGCTIMGGMLTRDERGDFFLPKSKTGIEVKGSTFQSSYGFRLSLQQIEQYESRVLSHEVESCWYMLFAYRNRSLRIGEGNKRITELSQHRSSRSISAYLSSAVKWAVLVDMSIVSRWKETLPRQKKSIMGHLGMVTVDVKCSVLEEIVEKRLASHLVEIGLNPQDYRRLTFDVKGYSSAEFPVTAVLLVEQALTLRKILKSRGLVAHLESV